VSEPWHRRSRRCGGSHARQAGPDARADLWGRPGAACACLPICCRARQLGTAQGGISPVVKEAGLPPIWATFGVADLVRNRAPAGGSGEPSPSAAPGGEAAPPEPPHVSVHQVSRYGGGQPSSPRRARLRWPCFGGRAVTAARHPTSLRRTRRDRVDRPAALARAGRAIPPRDGRQEPSELSEQVPAESAFPS
jgi:hypothetical protein